MPARTGVMGEGDGKASKALAQLRLVWAVLLAGQVAAGGVVGFLVFGRMHDPSAAGLNVLLSLAGTVALLVAVGVGYYVRGQIYKLNWRGHAVAPGGYFSGNVLLLGLLKGATLFALVVVLVTGRVLPAGAVALAGLVMQAVNFPTGKPMREDRPGFAGPKQG